MHHPRRWNVTTSMIGLKKSATYAKISPKMVNPRDLAGERRRRRRITITRSQSAQTTLPCCSLRLAAAQSMYTRNIVSCSKYLWFSCHYFTTASKHRTHKYFIVLLALRQRCRGEELGGGGGGGGGRGRGGRDELTTGDRWGSRSRVCSSQPG